MELSSHYNADTASKFATINASKTRLTHLIYRDIHSILSEYLTNGKALDFGCGPGVSTRFLSSLGFDVLGVDINKDMILNAFSKQDGTPFAWIKHGNIPAQNDTFDLVQSIMVLLEIPNLEEMQKAVNEISRVLKPDGIFLCVVGSEHFHKHNWFEKVTLELEKNQSLKSGDIFKNYSPSLNMVFEDHYYTDKDYKSVFKKANLEVIRINKSLGTNNDNIPWSLEKILNPFIHYICKKTASNF